MRVVNEVNVDSPKVHEELVHAGARQILALFKKILQDLEPELLSVKGVKLVHLDMIYQMIDELSKKKCTFITAENREEAERIFEDMHREKR